jgi:hypothetical protein
MVDRLLPGARALAVTFGSLFAVSSFSLGCSSAAVAPPTIADGGSDSSHHTIHDAGKTDAHHDAKSTADVVTKKDVAQSKESGGATELVFDLTADTTKPANFYSFPFPSDLRLNKTGGPDYSGLPLNPANTLLNGMVTEAGNRAGFSTLAVGYFRFTGPLKTLTATTFIPAGPPSSILLLDVDPTSPDRGTFFPTVAANAPEDIYTAANVVSVAAEPGFVLYPKRQYAYVILREQLDAKGEKLAVAPTLALLAAGKTPPGGAAAAKLYAPLWETLKLPAVDIAADDVAAATVFTTGDEVAVTSAMSDALVMAYSAPITGLTATAGDADAGSTYPRICELQGTITLPQFQTGTTPFVSSGGVFVLGADGVPVKQGEAAVPIAISIPTTGTMPAAGYPLTLYFHGTGGVSTEFIDRGPMLTPDGGQTPGQGPAYVLAPFGFAMAGASLPTSPQRVPGTNSNTDPPAYIQLTNLPALLGTFRQGVIEQRMFLAALAKLTIDPATLKTSCPAVKVPKGQMIHFDPNNFYSQGQSMGGMYANLITAVEPSFKAEVPTGAGGFWTYFIFQSAFVPNANGELNLALGVKDGQLTFMHPALSMVETGWEGIDPIVSVPRVSRRPLPGTSPRPIYEPVGTMDLYFSEDVYNAVSTAYGHREVGSELWPQMQAELAEEKLGGLLSYPVSNDVKSLDGTPYTGVVVQYAADAISMNGHDIAFQLDDVKYQYGCFLYSVMKTGVGVVPAPAALGTPCPLVDGGK